MIVDFLPFFNGRYHDISVGWIRNVGTVICYVILATIVIFQVQKIQKYREFKRAQLQDQKRIHDPQ